MAEENNPDRFKSVRNLKIPDMVRQNADALNHLRQLGLNQYEAQAYLALSLSGHGTAGELAENAELPRPRVYDVLDKLQEKGFVVMKPGRPVRYASLPLQEAVKTLKNQKQASLSQEMAQIDEISEKLASKLRATKAAPSGKFEPDSHVWTLKGREAIYSKLASMVRGASDRVVVSSDPAGVASKLKAHLAEFEAAKKRGVHVSFVSPVSDNKELSADLAGVAHRVLSKKMPTRMVLADDQALMFLTGENTHPDEEIGLWVKSPHLSQTLEQSLGLPAQKAKA
jgi:sugar-specific transcriptional regulator TrmB